MFLMIIVSIYLPMTLMYTFLDRLIKLESWQRRSFLNGVYKQVTPMLIRKGKQKKGIYRGLITKSKKEEMEAFLILLACNMKDYGLESQSENLLGNYGLKEKFREFEENERIKSLRKLKEMYNPLVI